MTIAQTSRTRVSVKEETAENTLPAGNFTTLEFLSSTFSLEKDSESSQTIRSDYQRTDILINGYQVSGDIVQELQFNGPDLFLKHLLRSADTFGAGTVPAASATVTATFTASNNRIAGSATDFAAFNVGDIVRVSGDNITEIANGADDPDGIDGIVRVITAIGASDEHIEVDGAALVDEAAVAGVIVEHDGIMVNGTTIYTMAVERSWLDIGLHELDLGNKVGQLQMQLPTQGPVTMTWSLLGRKSQFGSSAYAAGYDASPSDGEQVITAPNHWAYAVVEGVTGDACPINVTFNINGDTRPQRCGNSIPLAGVGVGTYSIEATGEFFFLSNGLYERFINDQVTGFWVGVFDQLGQGYVFRIIEGRFTAAGLPIPGINQDMRVNVTIMARRDSTLDATIQVAKFDALT